MTMKMATIARIALTVAVLGGVSLSAAPASAAADQIYGGCFFDTDQPPTTTGGYTGVIGDVSATTNGVNIQIGAVVSCKIQVNGVDAPGTTFSYSGYGVQAGTNQISFDALNDDIVSQCQRVVYQDGVDTGWACTYPINLSIPPNDEFPPIETALEVLGYVSEYSIDPQICPILAAHPGTYDSVTIGPDGDVSAVDPFDLWTGPVYDCPPYGN